MVAHNPKRAELDAEAIPLDTSLAEDWSIEAQAKVVPKQ